MQRRGPDDFGIWRDDLVVFGHRRLSVIDVTNAGHQPMRSIDGRFVIVFNGEIYNHLELRGELHPVGGWRSTSDTETLLEAFCAWGPRCLSRLNGMFAFAIWDRLTKRLFLARDRLGVKPLYYSWDKGVFSFASRPVALTKVLGAEKPELNPEALRLYLELGYVPSPLAFFRGIQKLPQAHYLIVDGSGPHLVRYWDFRHIAPDASWLARSEDDLADELDELIKKAVRLRLISDVPLGAFLSGGVDSALVVAEMKAAGLAAPKAFTMAFKEPNYNEGPAATETAQHLGVDHIVETLSVNNLLELLPTCVEEYDEPLADSSAFPTMAVARLAKRHVTVALTGDGADELFGGYHYYPLVDRLARVGDVPRPAKLAAHRLLSLLPMHKAKLLSHALLFDDRVELFQYLRSFSKDFAPLASQELLASTSSSAIRFAEAAGCFPLELTASEIGMRLDTRFTLADDYLQKVDVATMAYSLEARSPFMDYRLVEWAMRLPLHYKVRDGETKYLLKRVLSRHLPESMIYKPKKGFGIPVASWLRGPLKNWAEELLNDRSLLRELPIDRARLLQIFNLHIRGTRDAHPILWSALMLLCFVARHVNGSELPLTVRRKAA